MTTVTLNMIMSTMTPMQINMLTNGALLYGPYANSSLSIMIKKTMNFTPGMIRALIC